MLNAARSQLIGKRSLVMFEEAGFVSGPFLSVSEAAKRLGVGRKIVYQLIEWGELRVVKAGGSVQIEKASLDDFLAAGKSAFV